MRLLVVLFAAPLAAHMVSISTGEVRLEGNRARYEMRMPWYEIVHVRNPERSLLESIRFASGGAEARMTDRRCQKVEAESAMLCEATLEFGSPVEVLEVKSSFHVVTVPNHVHLLRATREDRTDQAVLDLSFPSATLRFRPPTPWEIAVQQSVSGALRAAAGLAQLLFLAALVIAARSRKELIALTAMFLAGEAAACLVLPGLAWQPAPRFVEAAAALTIAYLAVEILLLPKAGQRWLVVAVLGIFHGMYFSLFITASDYRAGWVLLGVFAAELVMLAGFAWVLSRLAAALESLQPVRVASAVLLAIGLGWFFLRLRQ